MLILFISLLARSPVSCLNVEYHPAVTFVSRHFAASVRATTSSKNASRRLSSPIFLPFSLAPSSVFFIYDSNAKWTEPLMRIYSPPRWTIPRLCAAKQSFRAMKHSRGRLCKDLTRCDSTEDFTRNRSTIGEQSGVRFLYEQVIARASIWTFAGIFNECIISRVLYETFWRLIKKKF